MRCWLFWPRFNRQAARNQVKRCLMFRGQVSWKGKWQVARCRVFKAPSIYHADNLQRSATQRRVGGKSPQCGNSYGYDSSTTRRVAGRRTDWACSVAVAGIAASSFYSSCWCGHSSDAQAMEWVCLANQSAAFSHVTLCSRGSSGYFLDKMAAFWIEEREDLLADMWTEEVMPRRSLF